MRRIALPALLLPLVLAPSASAAPMFTGLGLGSDPTSFQSLGTGISGDGSVVVGYSRTSTGNEGWTWTASGGRTVLDDLGSNDVIPTDVSGDGSVVVGRVGGNQAAVWTSSGVTTIAGADWARGVSADGQHVIGETLTSQTFLWNAVDGSTTITTLPGGDPWSRPGGISADGAVVVGVAGSGNGTANTSSGCCEAFRWENGTIQGLGDLPGGEFDSRASAITPDGTTIIGSVSTADDPQAGAEIFKWTEATGMVGLGRQGLSTGVNDVSADGNLIIGVATGAEDRATIIWDPVNGIQNLQSVLEDGYGLDLDGWTLTTARAISDDGRFIVGLGDNPDGQREAWFAEIDSNIPSVVSPSLPEPGPLALMTLGLSSAALRLRCSRRNASSPGSGRRS